MEPLENHGWLHSCIFFSNRTFSNPAAGFVNLSEVLDDFGTLPETNSLHLNGWLEYYFPIGEAYFQGRTVSFREGSNWHHSIT